MPGSPSHCAAHDPHMQVSGAAINMAASVARPGRDTVTIVTIVADSVFRDRAAELLQKHKASFAQANPGVQCFSEIKVGQAHIAQM